MTNWELPPGVEAVTIERAGGGGYIWESGAYKAVVKLAYTDKSKGGAIGLNIVLENSAGKELKETLWIQSGDKKGNKTYYTDKKSGKDFPLPGYSVANSLCVAATGDSLAKTMGTAEMKTINVWNSELKKEAPAEREVVMALVNKNVTVAMHQILEDKQSKNEAGTYVSTGETKAKNESKFFGNAEGKTAEEITKGKEATAFTAWAEKNTGVVIDKSTKSTGTSAASIMGETAEAKSAVSLFK